MKGVTLLLGKGTCYSFYRCADTKNNGDHVSKAPDEKSKSYTHAHTNALLRGIRRHQVICDTQQIGCFN